MLVTMKEILHRANQGHYGVIAPNVGRELDARAALEAAEEKQAPIILDVFYTDPADFQFFGSYVTRLADMANVPVAVQLDHGGAFAQGIDAIRAGFTSIMVDRSSAPYEQNVAEVAEMVHIAHSIGVSVEAELGHVGQGSNYDVDGAAALTDPQQAKAYIEQTGVDALAVAIGTAHGFYSGTPRLDFDRLVAIKAATGHPLVLHGGSGTGDENLRKACQLGINKVNIGGELIRAAYDAIQQTDLSGNNVYGLFNIISAGFKGRVKELIDIFGSAGKAWSIAPKGIARGQSTPEV